MRLELTRVGLLVELAKIKFLVRAGSNGSLIYTPLSGKNRIIPFSMNTGGEEKKKKKKKIKKKD